MIPFKYRSTPALAPAAGWASAAPWAAFHHDKPAAAPVPIEAKQHGTPAGDQDGCCAGSWGY